MLLEHKRERVVIFILLTILMVGGICYAEWEKGMNCYKAKDYVCAEKEFQEVIQRNASHPAGYYLLALTQLKLKKIQEAKSNFLKVIELEPKHFGSYYQLALIASSNNDDKAVIQYLDKGLLYASSNDDKASCYKLRGATYLKLEEYEKAAADLEEAIKLAPNDANVNYLNGLISLHYRKYSEAYNYLDRAYRMKPDNKLYARYLLEAANGFDRYSRAKEVGEFLISRGENSPEVLSQLGFAYMNLREYDKAEEILSKLPANSIKLFNLTQLYLATKNWKKAESTLLEWKKIEPENYKIYEFLGLVYENLRKPSEAIVQYQKALKLTGNAKYQEFIKRAQLEIEQLQKQQPQEKKD